MTAVEAKQNNTVPPKPVVPAIKPTVTTEAQEAQKAKAAEKAKETSGEGSGGFSFSFDSNFASYQNAISFLDTRQDIMKGLENALGNSKEDQIAEAKHEENVDRD